MRVVFWLSAALVAYVYAGYPLLLIAWSRLIRKGSSLPEPARRDAPGISIIVAARNEAAVLPARIDNLLTIDYPASRRQIIVVSDGSTDDTDGVLEPFADRIELVAVTASGKSAALNAGVARACHEILVFADARQSFDEDTLTALTAPFADPAVGAVSGELILGCEPAGRRSGVERRADDAPAGPERRASIERRGDLSSTVADAVGMYWRYEKGLRQLESNVGSMLGATGAVYALRRSLWQPLPDGTLLDDVLAPMRGVLAGRRIVFEPAARAYDSTTPDSSAERRRKLRTLAGNFQILWLEPRLLVPFVNPVWLQYVSHKVGRLLVPYALVALFTASLALSTAHPFYALALAGQCVLYLLGGYGALLELESAPLASPAFVKDRGAARA